MKKDINTNKKNIDTIAIKNLTKTRLMISVGIVFSFILGVAFMGVLTISDNEKVSSIVSTPLLVGGQEYVCGDINGLDGVDISDLTYLIDYMFNGGANPPEPLARANVDGIGDIDIADLTYLIDYMFNGGEELICDNTIVEHISPEDDVWVETPGDVTFTCHVDSTTDITETSIVVREFYGGWEMNGILSDEVVSMSGIKDKNFDFSSTINLTNGFYTYDCLATNSLGVTESSGERRYKTGVGDVYIVHAIDTEPDRIANLLGDPNVLNLNIGMTSFLPGNNVESIMNYDWRNNYVDSLGNPNNFVWFMRSDEVVCQSDEGCDAVADYLYLDETFNYSEQINQNNDSLAWHYHNAEYYNYLTCPPGHNNSPAICQTSDIYWNQKTTFNNTIYREKTDVDLAESIFSQFIMDTQLFPVSYRAGWIWQNTDMSNWLETFMPFDYSNYPGLQTEPHEDQPMFNEYDWSTASHYPYHPSDVNYLEKGNMDRIIVPCTTGTSELQNYYSVANQGADVIFCYYTHNFGSNSMKYGTEELHNNYNIQSLQLSYPNVDHIYANDVEVAKGMLKIQDDISPIITIAVSADQKWLNITSSEELYKPPYLAIQSSDDYYRGELVEVSSTEWKFNIEGLDIVKAAVGGTDLGYNPFYEEIVF